MFKILIFLLITTTSAIVTVRIHELVFKNESDLNIKIQLGCIYSTITTILVIGMSIIRGHSDATFESLFDTQLLIFKYFFVSIIFSIIIPFFTPLILDIISLTKVKIITFLARQIEYEKEQEALFEKELDTHNYNKNVKSKK